MESVFNYINADTAYRELDFDPLSETVNLINNKLEELCSNNHISTKMKKTLRINESLSKLGSIRLMAKMHKKTFDWRAIINCKRHPTSKISVFFDLLIKPIIINTETYLKDSQNLIQICGNIYFDKKPKIYSFDVTALYPNIDPIHAIPLITDFLTKYLDLSHINSFGLKSLLDLFFKNNIFRFKNKYYIQISGLPMGCICGPTIANIFMYILEMKWLIIDKPLVYRRFIDDGIIITDKPFCIEIFVSFFLNLKFTFSTGETVNFLDLNISFNQITNKLKFSLYTKPTHINKYLLPTSNHPTHVFKNIVDSLLIRLRRISSEYYDFVSDAGQLIIKLLERGYKFKSIRASFFIISNIDRNSLIAYKTKLNNIDFSKNILFFYNFNYNLYKFNDMIFSSFNNTAIKFPVLNNFSIKTVKKIENNLNSIFVHDLDLTISKNFYTKKCFNCRICNFIYNHSFFNIKNSNISINLRCNANCQTSNIIYIILCLKCKVFYIGETEKSLACRISQHIYTINNFQCFKKFHDKEVAKHFNKKGHNIMKHFRCCIFKDKFLNEEQRKSNEMDLVNFLNINYFKCLNVYTNRKDLINFAFS